MVTYFIALAFFAPLAGQHFLLNDVPRLSFMSLVAMASMAGSRLMCSRRSRRGRRRGERPAAPEPPRPPAGRGRRGPGRACARRKRAPAQDRPGQHARLGDGVAIRGFDPVAYFREGAPRRGLAEHSIVRDEAVWRFASAENKALFAADPLRYLPAFGGFCAYGTSRGYLVKTEPEAWSIISAGST